MNSPAIRRSTRPHSFGGHIPACVFGVTVGLSLGGLMLRAAASAEAPLKYENPKSLTAAIYGRGSNRQKLLFDFKRQATRTGTRLTVLRDFNYPDGKPAAQEQVVYEGDNLAAFVLREFQTGAQGSAIIRRTGSQPGKATIEFQYGKSPGAAVKRRNEPLRENTLIADMIGPFLAEHWEALIRGERLKFRYIVVPRLETVGFTFVKESASVPGNPAAVLVKMEPGSRIIAALVDPLYFQIEKAPPHRVLEYNGRTTPKFNDRGQWEDFDAVTVFDWK